MDPSNPNPPPPPLSTQEPPQAPQDRSADDRLWATLAHLLALLGFIFPFGNLIAPLIVWLLVKDRLPFAADQAKESLNFNLTTTIFVIMLLAMTFVTLGLGALVTIPFMLLISLAWLVLTIIAAIKANEGTFYRYPMTIRLVG